MRKVLFYVVFLLNIYIETNCGCNLSLKNDFGNPSPVYLKNGDFLAPNATGAILFRRSETMRVACPGKGRFIILGTENTTFDVFDIKCVKDSTFRASKGSWVGNLKDIKCSGPPWFTTEHIGSCYKKQKLYRVGYKIEDDFHSLYEACFDRDLVNTLYVKHILKPNALHIQTGRRPSFIEGELFGKLKMSKLYTMIHQKSRLKTILGEGMDAHYVTKAQYLNRGHLAPRADFPLLAQQRATFHYVNTAPQWSRGNAGDWAALEDALRRRVNKYGSPLTIYTGTYGVTTLEDKASIHRKIFLEVDDNNNEILPVPMYFYKIVHDPKESTATAFVSINSSFYNRTALDQLSLCADVCEGSPLFSWLRWRSNDGTHSFCCSYSEFAKEINVVPELNVNGLFC